MDAARLVEALHEHTAGFAKAVEGADPEARVPTCPEWPLRVLVGHIGQAHRWSAGNIRTGPSDANPTCTSVGLGQFDHQVSFYCYTGGAGGTWTYLYDASINRSGWVKDSLLDGYGSNYGC